MYKYKYIPLHIFSGKFKDRGLNTCWQHGYKLVACEKNNNFNIQGNVSRSNSTSLHILMY